MRITDEQLKQILEAALMAASEALTIDKMMALFAEDKEPPTRDDIKNAIKLIEQESENRGIELKKVSSGYRFQAKKDFSPWVSRLWEEKPARYSRALLETLVLIAYKQPLTRGEVEQVRGVAVSTNIIKTLLERDWVKVVGHREVPGRPALYATTKAFLDYFNLKSLDELPTLAEIRDLEKINPELDLQEPGTESVSNDGGSERDESQKEEQTELLTEEDSGLNEAEVSEEEIDINIEDTENIRGVTESVSDESEAEVDSQEQSVAASEEPELVEESAAIGSETAAEEDELVTAEEADSKFGS